MAGWQDDQDTDRVVAAITAASDRAHNDNVALVSQLKTLNDQIGSLRELVETTAARES